MRYLYRFLIVAVVFLGVSFFVVPEVTQPTMVFLVGWISSTTSQLLQETLAPEKKGPNAQV